MGEEKDNRTTEQFHSFTPCAGSKERRDEKQNELTSLRASRTLISTSSSTASTSATSSVSDMIDKFDSHTTLGQVPKVSRRGEVVVGLPLTDFSNGLCI